MRRREIDFHIAQAEAFFEKISFRMPPWSSRRPAEWKGRRAEESEIVEDMLGRDLTDFGSEDFDRIGLLLFILRKGNPRQEARTRGSKSYAEKIMFVGESQETPLQFHWSKMEDIIVYGGGDLVVQVWASTSEEGLSAEPLRLSMDGASQEIPAGGSIVIGPGESVCLEPRVYHRFYGDAGEGRVLVGEVSAVNSDASDNRFREPTGRFLEIDEDEELYRLFVSDYEGFL